MSVFDSESDVILIPEITTTPTSVQVASPASSEAVGVAKSGPIPTISNQPVAGLSSSETLAGELQVPALDDSYIFPEDSTIIELSGVSAAEFAAAKELDRRVYHEKLEVAVWRQVTDDDEFKPFFIQPHSYIHYTKWADDVNEDDDKVDYEVDSDDEDWIAHMNGRVFGSCIAEICKENGIGYEVIYGHEGATTFSTRRKAGLLPHIRIDTIQPTSLPDIDDSGDVTKYVASPSSSASTTPVAGMDAMEGIVPSSVLVDSTSVTSPQEEMTISALLYGSSAPPFPVPTFATDPKKQSRLEQELLDLYNRRRISEWDFEFVIDVFEKQAYLLKSTIVLPDEGDEDQVCSVCLDGTSDDTNQILFCDGCNIAVHQHCYGVRLIPEGEWKCNRCTHAEKSGRPVNDALTTVLCDFCGRPGGAMKRTTSEGEWVHVQCALWLPETELDAHCVGNVRYVCEIPKDRRDLRCYICNLHRGAPIQCADPECVQAFHVTCAQDKRLCLTKVEHEEGDETVLEFNAWCGKHTPSDYRYKRAELLADDKHKQKKESKTSSSDTPRGRKRKSSASAQSPRTITTRSAVSTPRKNTYSKKDTPKAPPRTPTDSSSAVGMVTRSKSPYVNKALEALQHRGNKRRKLSEEFAVPLDSNGRSATASAPSTPKQKKRSAPSGVQSAPETPVVPKPEPTTTIFTTPPAPSTVNTPKRKGRIQPTLLSPTPSVPAPLVEADPEPQFELEPSFTPMDVDPIETVPVPTPVIKSEPPAVKIESPVIKAEALSTDLVPDHEDQLLPPPNNSKSGGPELVTPPAGAVLVTLLFFNNDGAKDPEFGTELTEEMALDTLRYCWGLTLREARRRVTSALTPSAPKTGEVIRSFRMPPKLLPGIFFEIYKYWFDKRRRRRGAPLLKKFAPSLSRKEAPPKLTEISTRELVSTYRQLRMLRTHVERIRLVLEVTRKRERLKRELMRANVEHFELEHLPEVANMRHLLEFFKAADSNGFFSMPVSTEIAPTYYDIIKNPMDFRTMEDKLNTFQYCGEGTDPDSVDEGRNKFIADLRLITRNAMEFNGPDTIYYQEAQRLDELITQVLQGEYVAPEIPPEDQATEMDHVSDVIHSAQDDGDYAAGGILSDSNAQLLIGGLIADDQEDAPLGVVEYDMYEQPDGTVAIVREPSTGFLDLNLVSSSRNSSPMKIRPPRRISSLLEPPSIPEEAPVADIDDNALVSVASDTFSNAGSATNSQNTAELNADLVNSFWN